MKTQAKFYHAGCPVCVDAEQTIARSLDPARFEVEIVHLGDAADRIAEARDAGIKSVPALVYNGHVLHINHGADLADLAA
ncbi:MAG: thioredoxin family protein [Planctomycetota bacterium]